MTSENELKSLIRELLIKYKSLADPDSEAEKRAEDFIKELFKPLGWDFLSREVMPQQKVKTAARTRRVDFAFRKSGDLRTFFYLDAKRFSNDLENPADVKQVLDYGKNSGIRWVVLS